MTSAPDQVPTPEEPAPDQAPRRGASAQFQVAESAGTQAAMRQAMDPANQSLAEALRLSYRVLQLAILVLVVVFCFSGFQSVSEGQTGVKAIFGRIVGEPGQEQLQPGLQPFWPYPVGQITLVDQKRVVELRNEFWPKLPAGQTTLEQATAAADPNTPIRPGIDGSLVTGDGDLVHVQITAEYTVDDAVRLLEELAPEKSDQLVRRALMQGMVQTAAQFTLQELLESRDQPAQVLRTTAQAHLDDLKCGLRLSSVTIPEKIAPLAVRNAFQKVQEARENAKVVVQKSQQDANNALVSVAGPRYVDLLTLIDEYETQLTRGDTKAAEDLLAKIGTSMEAREATGEVSRIINRAQASQSGVSAELAKDARRLKALSNSFHENPTQLVRQLWLEGLRDALDSNLVEVFAIGANGARKLAITSSPEVMQARRQDEVNQRKNRNDAMGAMIPSFQLGSKLLDTKAGRRLDEKAEKGFGRD